MSDLIYFQRVLNGVCRTASKGQKVSDIDTETAEKSQGILIRRPITPITWPATLVDPFSHCPILISVVF